jgi:hypothetical protein
MADRVAIAGGTRVLVRLLGSTTGPISTAAGTELPEVESLGDISETNAEVQATPLASKVVRYISGLTDGAPMEITMFLLTDNAVQEAVHAAQQQRRELEITVQPDDTALQYRFNYLPNGHTLRLGAAGDPKRRVVAGRVNSAVINEANKNPAYVAATGGGGTGA